jgi:epoxyqueuosine reductase QueG
MQKDLKAGLIEEMKRVGAWEVRSADPHRGFEHAPPGRHPLELMPDCRSVVAFAVPRAQIPDCFYVGIRRSTPQPPDYWTWSLPVEDKQLYIGHRLAFLLTAYVILKAASYLSEWGFRTVEQCDKQRPGQPMLPEKLCAFEAGLGVYGRSGLILHPQLGNRSAIGVLLTDAKLETDGRLAGFEPCRDCDACVRACPAGAYGRGGSYHGVWSRERRETTRQELRAQGYAQCTLCWSICPLGDHGHDELFLIDVRRSEPLTEVEQWVRRARERVGVEVTPRTLRAES